MQVVEINYLKSYEPHFIQFLLNGMAEKELGCGPKCIKFIEDHGKRMREALIALGEETEQATEKPADEKMSSSQTTEKDEVPV